MLHYLNLTAFHKGFNSWIGKESREKTHGGNAVEIALEAVAFELWQYPHLGIWIAPCHHIIV